MRNLTLWALLGLTTACLSDLVEVEEPVNPDLAYCIYNTDYSAPVGFSLNRLDSIELDGSLSKLQMIDQQQGYLLGTRNYGGYLRVYQTLDGGQTWNVLPLNAEEQPLNFFFLNAEVGFISHYGGNANVLRTTDGGATWNRLNFPELQGNMYHIQQDSQGNLYAMLAGLDSETVIIKSGDQGLSWQILYAEALGFKLVTYGFTVTEDKIYASGEEGTLVVLDLNGSLIKTISTGQSYFWDVEVVDEDNIVVVAEQTVKTADGGESWQMIYDGSARMIDFPTAETGIMFLNKGYCPTDVVHASDVIAVTQDGGQTWTEGEEAYNLMTNFADGQKISDGRYLLVIGQEIYELRQQ